MTAAATRLGAAPAAAQTPTLPEEVASAPALEAAAQTLAEKGRDSVLTRDLLDRPVGGEGGFEIGIAEDFAVMPGGGLAVAIVRRPDGGHLAIPFKAEKLGAPLEVPFAAPECTGMSARSSCADALSQ